MESFSIANLKKKIMKKIIFSLSIIAVAAAIVIGGTYAYFSDTETSTGNTFTAGQIDLKVSDVCSYYQNGINVNCPENSNWETGDLGEVNKFFYFSDLKPGDYGTNVIDFNIINNDAWMCAEFTTDSDENGLNEPELSMDPADTEPVGELGNYLNVMWWNDADQDGTIDTGEKILYDGPRTLADWLALNPANEGNQSGDGTLPLTFADSQWNWLTGTTINPMIPNTPFYVGVAWCLGTIDYTDTGFTCDGAAVDNDAQSDKIDATLSFYVVQARNNATFKCAEHKSPTGSNDLGE